MNAQPQALSGEPIKPVRPGKTREPSRWWTFVERRLPIITIYLMVISLVGAILAPHVVVTVPSGHVGLMWKRFRGACCQRPGSRLPAARSRWRQPASSVPAI